MAGFDVARVIAAHQAGLNVKRSKQKEATDLEDREYELKQRDAQSKLDKINLELAKRKVQQENVAQMEGSSGGSVASMLQTQRAPIPHSLGSDEPGPTPKPETIGMSSTPIPLPEMEVGGVPSLGVSGYTKRPQSSEQQQAQTVQDKLMEIRLDRAKNTYTVTDPTTKQEVTGPKDLVDNLLTQSGANARQDESIAATATQHEADRKASDERAAADRKSREAIAAANRTAADLRAKNTQTAKPPTEGERKAFGFYTRLSGAKDLIDGMEADITKLGMGGQIQLNHAPNFAQSQLGQNYNQASADFINAALRRESGAAIQQSEYDRFNRIYFPQPGDTPKTLKQKAASRKLVVTSLKAESGRAYKETFGEDDSAAPSSGPAHVDLKSMSTDQLLKELAK